MQKNFTLSVLNIIQPIEIQAPKKRDEKKKSSHLFWFNFSKSL